jgi:hypothetical protein
VSETQGGFAPTGRREVGISPWAVRGGGRVQKMARDSETLASSSDDGANSLYGSFGSGPSSYGSNVTQTGSSYGWFGAGKLKTIQRRQWLEEQR